VSEAYNIKETKIRTTNSKEDHRLPIVLIVQALKMEKPSTEEALQLNKEKLRIFETYSPYFRQMVIDSPLYPKEKDACGDPAFKDTGLDCRYCSYTRPLGGPTMNQDEHRYACVGEIMQDMLTFGEVEDDIMGALVIHADFYLLPSIVQRTVEKLEMYPDSFWLAQRGLPPDSLNRFNVTFTNDTIPKTEWLWPRVWPRVEKFRKDLARYVGREDRILVPSAPSAWADLYYTPRTFWRHFIPFSRIMMKHAIVNEVAIPLVHHMIADMYDLDRGVPQYCAGGCCESPLGEHLKSPERMSTLPCGHKFDLVSSSARNSLLEVWQAQLPSLQRLALNETV
jgi:hypothetical protein